MVLGIFIIACLAIGLLLPQLLVPRLSAGVAVLAASVLTLITGAGVIWLGAQAFDTLGIEDAGTAFDRGFNAWKIMLLLAPASALHARRKLEKEKL